MVQTVPTRLEIDARFIEKASAVGPPEARFRFGGRCVEGQCRQWTGNSCGVIERVLTGMVGAGHQARRHAPALRDQRHVPLVCAAPGDRVQGLRLCRDRPDRGLHVGLSAIANYPPASRMGRAGGHSGGLESGIADTRVPQNKIGQFCRKGRDGGRPPPLPARPGRRSPTARRSRRRRWRSRRRHRASGRRSSRRARHRVSVASMCATRSAFTALLPSSRSHARHRSSRRARNGRRSRRRSSSASRWRRHEERLRRRAQSASGMPSISSFSNLPCVA